jgi:hypothetical protein
MSVFSEGSVLAALFADKKGAAHLSTIMLADLGLSSVLGVLGLSKAEKLMGFGVKVFLSSLLD